MRFLNGTGILNGSYRKTAGKRLKNKNVEIISDCFTYNMLGKKKKVCKIKKNKSFLPHWTVRRLVWQVIGENAVCSTSVLSSGRGTAPLLRSRWRQVQPLRDLHYAGGHPSAAASHGHCFCSFCLFIIFYKWQLIIQITVKWETVKNEL